MNKSITDQIEEIYVKNWAAGVDEDEEIIIRLKKTKNGYKAQQLKQDRGGIIIRLPLKDLEHSEDWIGIFLE